MRLAAALAVFASLILSIGARAVDYVSYPDSGSAVWLSDDLIRFETNLGTHTRDTDAYVVAPDGSGLRPASAPEASAQPASAGSVSPDGRTHIISAFVGWYYADGHVLYAAPLDGPAEPVRLTPTPCSVSSSTRSALTGRCFDGSDRSDRIVGTSGGDLIIGGSGADAIQAGNGQNEIESQWGSDQISSGKGPDTIWAGAGNDTIASGAGSDTIIPGGGRDTVDAGPGVDYVFANDGQRDTIDCGLGDDRVVADRIDVLQRCEHRFFNMPGASGPKIP